MRELTFQKSFSSSRSQLEQLSIAPLNSTPKYPLDNVKPHIKSYKFSKKANKSSMIYNQCGWNWTFWLTLFSLPVVCCTQLQFQFVL